MSAPAVHRILTIDDNPAIHEDFRKLFALDVPESAAFDELEAQILGGVSKPELTHRFELDSASQGQEGLEKVRVALAGGRPYALAFVDVRMPPGWDGVETIQRIWQVDPDIQIVICTAYSDFSWEEIRNRLGNSDALLVLKKPFDTIEVLQIAHALTRKWELAREVRFSLQDLDRKVCERTEALQREIAERSRVEEDLRQSQKMEAVGQLAAGVAHDFNNILTIIRGHTELLISHADPGAPGIESLRQISLAAERAAGLTRQLLVFSRKEMPRYQPVDLNQVLENSGALLRRLLGEHVEMRLEPSEAPVCLSADESNLSQVILNLAVNARDAMPEGGLLTLRTSLETLDANATRRHPQAGPGTFACLTVTDTGTGMDEVTLSRMFEPFFTTKEVGKGTGLGLASVYGIVQQHKGWIDVVSQLGQGTTFKIFFPQHECPVVLKRQTEMSSCATAPAVALTTILVVEDEPGVREFICTILKSRSYRVLEAVDGVDALKVWARHRDEVTLLFTDLVMPNGLSGRGLADKLQSERPDLKIVYASGYSAEAIGANWLQAPGVEFLPKPFTAAGIIKAVSTVLSAKNPAFSP
jgi:two-component system, NtrC family, sensor kinase